MSVISPQRNSAPGLSLPLLILALFAFFLGCHQAGATATVLRVIDGDTIEVQLASGQRAKVRYIGIDTPEVSGRPECYGAEATKKNRELVEGKPVTLEKDVSETDRFGRLLRYVYVDGRLINGELVREGYARAVAYPPDVRLRAQLATLEREAKANRLGLWGACLGRGANPIPPDTLPLCAATDCDCSDFATQREAQAFYELFLPGDPHGLDVDRDGRAWQALP